MHAKVFEKLYNSKFLCGPVNIIFLNGYEILTLNIFYLLKWNFIYNLFKFRFKKMNWLYSWFLLNLLNEISKHLKNFSLSQYENVIIAAPWLANRCRDLQILKLSPRVKILCRLWPQLHFFLVFSRILAQDPARTTIRPVTLVIHTYI